jgi:hypothetical protein
MYAKYLEKHVQQLVGQQKAGAVDEEILDFALRRAPPPPHPLHPLTRLVDHRTPRDHKCDERCRPHTCNGLSSTTIRHIHFILRGAYEKGVRWRWVARNPILLIAAPPARPGAEAEAEVRNRGEW